MSDESSLRSISRRKILAGLGAVGVGVVGSGLGTSALLRDVEEFPNNTLAAGEFDLKVDWEEHYYDDTASDHASLTHDVVTLAGDPSNIPTGYVGLPTPTAPMVAVAEEDLQQFMDNTAIEAYPDPDNDGIQDSFASESGATTDKGVGYICEDGADTPDDLDPTSGEALRTNNSDTYDATTESWQPLFALDDLKPGDAGETTLSFHLCDNPGRVWLHGGLISESENGYTEPELNHSTDTTPNAGELVDAIQTRLWYDDGDNVAEVGTDDPAWLTEQQSLRDLLTTLDNEPGIQLCPGGDEDKSCLQDAEYDTLHTTGDDVVVQRDGETQTITISQNAKCTDFGYGNGFKLENEATDPIEVGTQTYSTSYGDITLTTESNGEDEPITITDWSFDSPGGYCIKKIIVKGGSQGANVYSYDNNDGDDDFTNDDADLGAVSATDTALVTPSEQEISHISFCLNSGDNCCFEPSTDHYIGLAWWLPPTVGNEIQSDSVSFGIGFFTEQCRHSDSIASSGGTGGGPPQQL